MTRVLVFSRDPGGANCTLPVARRLLARGTTETLLFCKDAACRLYRAAGLAVSDASAGDAPPVDAGSARRFLASHPVDALVTGTSFADRTEPLLWDAAAALGIPAVAILDYWGNYRLRFPGFTGDAGTGGAATPPGGLPAIICIMDDFARVEMLAAGFPADRLQVTGQPYLEDLLLTPAAAPGQREAFRRRHGIAGDAPVITFASEPIRQGYGGPDYWGYDESSILAAVAAALGRIARRGGDAPWLIVRPHPKETAADGVPAGIAAAIAPGRIALERELPPRALIRCSDAVIGMSSMFLLEAAALGTPVFSVQIGLRRPDPFPLGRMGRLEPILTQERLEQALALFLERRGADPVAVPLLEHATDNILALLDALAGARRG